jgi:hypothetical protein
VARTEIATASIGIELAPTKYSLVEVILTLLKIYEDAPRIKK